MAICDADFQTKLETFLSEAGVSLSKFYSDYPNGVAQMNSDTKYNVSKIIDNIKATYTPSSYFRAFVLILNFGLVVKCYPNGDDTGIWIGGTDAFLDFINQQVP